MNIQVLVFSIWFLLEKLFILDKNRIVKQETLFLYIKHWVFSTFKSDKKD